MKIKLIVVGKTDESYVKEGIDNYLKRLKHYVSFEIKYISDLKLGKKGSAQLQNEKEGKQILESITSSDYLILLDERGAEYNSVGFSKFIQKKLNAGRDIYFVIGGPYGFSEEVYQRSNAKIALSQMTFSHQMVRLFFIEQLYRGFSILKGEKYHH